MTSQILIRCDASPGIGFGHVVRCLALADELHSRHGWQVVFAMAQGPQGIVVVREHGYPVRLPPEDREQTWDEGQWLQQVVAETGAGVLVLDVRSDLAPVAVRAVRDRGVLIVTLDDPSERRLVADLAFYPPVPQVRRLDWTGFTGQLFVGWEWIVLRPEFARYREFSARRSRLTPHASRLTILVTMGGSDPAGLTLKALAALDRLDGDFETIVVLGPGFMHEQALATWLGGACRRYDLRRNVQDMAGLMVEADLAVASFGVTAYELAAMGVPAVYLCLTEDHAEAATALAEVGVATSLGLHERVAVENLSRVVAGLLGNAERRKIMAERAPMLVDGCGVLRIAELIDQKSKSRYGINQAVERA